MRRNGNRIRTVYRRVDKFTFIPRAEKRSEISYSPDKSLLRSLSEAETTPVEYQVDGREMSAVRGPSRQISPHNVRKAVQNAFECRKIALFIAQHFFNRRVGGALRKNRSEKILFFFIYVCVYRVSCALKSEKFSAFRFSQSAVFALFECECT